MPSSDWQPLLVDTELGARALVAARARVAELAAGTPGPLLPRPLLERTLVFTWAAEVEALALDLDLPALATSCLSRRIDAVGSEAEPARLFGGVAGLAWVLARLVECDDGEDPCAPILERLREVLDDPASARDYDLVGGLVGLGVAGLERIATPAGQRLTARVLDGLEQVGPDWLTPADVLSAGHREETPAGRHDLGLAHGVAGAIAYLARLVGAGVEPGRSGARLEQAVRYLLSTAPADPAGRFPPFLPGGTHRTQGRLAWCTGDLGIACALLAAGDAADRPAWRAEALALARAAAARSLDESGVHDAGFCHGAAGVAHLFNRLWQATGEPALQAAAVRWFEQLLAMPPPDSETLTTGSAGVALALLAAISPVEPAWDRLYLVDLGAVR